MWLHAIQMFSTKVKDACLPKLTNTVVCIRGLSGKYPAILNISRTGYVALLLLGSQSEETLFCVRKQSLSHGASQSAVRRSWLSLCTVWPLHSHWSREQISFITTMRLSITQLSCRLFLGGKTSHHPSLSPPPPLQPIFGSLRLLVLPKAKIIVKREEIYECDGHTVHKLSQRRLTADWLAPRENDCLRMRSKVSSDWLPSYIKATRPVLEIFKMAGYFPHSPRMYRAALCCYISLFNLV
jgi:hypothetical protein